MFLCVDRDGENLDEERRGSRRKRGILRIERGRKIRKSPYFRKQEREMDRELESECEGSRTSGSRPGRYQDNETR